jgi:hypothetical protein
MPHPLKFNPAEWPLLSRCSPPPCEGRLVVDAKVAHLLNERGMRTGAGDTFDTVSVKWVRYSAKIKSLKERLLEEGWLTVQQVSARLGIDRGTINRRRLKGQIKARLCNDHGQWVHWLPEPVTNISHETITNGSFTARDAA